MSAYESVGTRYEDHGDSPLDVTPVWCLDALTIGGVARCFFMS